MGLDETTADVQTQAGPTVRPGRRAVQLPKAVEQARHVARVDARAAVDHRDVHLVAPVRDLDAHVTLRVLERVLHEVVEHLVDLGRIGRELQLATRTPDAHALALVGVDQLAQVDLLDVQRGPVGVDRRHEQQVLDETYQTIDVAVDRPERELPSVRV